MAHGHRSIAITDRSSVGEARRAAVSAAQSLGFDSEQRSNVGIVATEAANNVVLHAQSGELLICPFKDQDALWLDLIALDSGPGIRDIGRAMEDGYSTIGTAGQGLGAINRLSDTSSLFSLPGKGTAYWSRFKNGQSTVASSAGVVNIPMKGESSAGDSYLVLEQGTRRLYMMVDGLGHGSGATEAATEAVAIVRGNAALPIAEIFLRAHNALKKTRGAAMSIAIVDSQQQTLAYAGIGNISATLVNGVSSRSLVSQNGTLGAVMPRTPLEHSYAFEQNTLLVMFSDGLSSKSSLLGYMGYASRPVPLLAGLLYRDFARRRDDATVMVALLGKRV